MQEATKKYQKHLKTLKPSLEEKKSGDTGWHQCTGGLLSQELAALLAQKLLRLSAEDRRAKHIATVLKPAPGATGKCFFGSRKRES